MKKEAQFALADAQATLQSCRSLIELLRGKDQAADGISIAPRQANELSQFIEAHSDELQRHCDSVRKSDSELNVQLLTTRYMELEEALRFVERAFIAPRTSGTERQVLEAADWLCVEGFQLFVPDTESSPVGPLVAIDSSQSPAVWAPDANLPIPSLFQTEPKQIGRKGDGPRTLAPFALVCLPGHLARSPESYPLLSHEVGHAVDNALGATDQIIKELPKGLRLKYWQKWMREIFADAVAVTLSGEAFLLSLAQYLVTMKPFEEVSAANIYPGNTLRRALIGECLSYFQTELTVVDQIPTEEEIRGRFGRTAQALLIEFREKLLPVIARHTFVKNANWPQEQAAITELVPKVERETTLKWSKQPFRLMPSLMVRAQQSNPALDTLEVFRNLHQHVAERPEWVEAPSKWVFSEEYLPSLRPTLLGADGQFKVPPLLLLATYQKIAFIGATNWQLAKMMEKAFQERGEKSWDQIHLFFATDELLKQVEYGKRDPQQERDQSEAEFIELLGQGRWAKRWAIYRFSGPPVFASYWDWDRRGGRIHISPALLGTVIGKCPSSDHIWHDKNPTDHYEKYVKHLQVLMRPGPASVVIQGKSSSAPRTRGP